MRGQYHLGALSTGQPLVHQPDGLVVHKLNCVPVGRQNIPAKMFVVEVFV